MSSPSSPYKNCTTDPSLSRTCIDTTAIQHLSDKVYITAVYDHRMGRSASLQRTSRIRIRAQTHDSTPHHAKYVHLGHKHPAKNVLSTLYIHCDALAYRTTQTHKETLRMNPVAADANKCTQCKYACGTCPIAAIWLPRAADFYLRIFACFSCKLR